MNSPARPKDGGSYRRNKDGSLTLLKSTTGPAPRKSKRNAAPTAPAKADDKPAPTRAVKE